MPATAPHPKKKVATPKSGAAAKPAAKAATAKPAKKNSNFIPNFFKVKIIVHPEFFDEHDRPANWPSGK